MKNKKELILHIKDRLDENHIVDFTLKEGHLFRIGNDWCVYSNAFGKRVGVIMKEQIYKKKKFTNYRSLSSWLGNNFFYKYEQNNTRQLPRSN